MPLTRWIITSKRTEAEPVRDAFVNTLYFNVSGSVDEPDYNSLGNDLYTLWAAQPWAKGRFLDIRGYNMDDPEPRQQRYIKRLAAAGTRVEGIPQVALALSYYADRNLPRKRGRIFIGPWESLLSEASVGQQQAVINLPPLLAALGGLNVDWSLYSPTTGDHMRINHAWCDASWDIIRSRKLAAIKPRMLWDGNG